MATDRPAGNTTGLFAALVEALPDAVIYKDEENRWRVANAAGRRLFGLADAAWEGMTDAQLAARHPAYAPLYAACAQGDEVARAGDTHLAMTARIRIPADGGLHTIDLTKTLLLHADGGCRGLLVIGRDVTARDRTEEAAHRQRASMRRLSELATAIHLPLPDQFHQALVIGTDHFGLEFGTVSRIEDDTVHVLSHVSPAQTPATGRPPALAQTYCSLTIGQGDVVAIEQVGRSPYRNHPGYRQTRLEAYIAARVMVDGRPYGTVSFSSSRPYARGFDTEDRELIQLLARWIGAAIERERMGKKLAESELQLRTIIETEPECVKLLAHDGSLLQMNRAGLEMVGADSLEQLRGQSIQPMVVPGYRREFDALTRHVFAGGSGRLEFEIVNLKGVHLWLETNAVPLRDTDGGITALLSVTRNISERKETELALQASEQRFRSVMDGNSVGMAIVSLDGRFLRVNHALCEIVGYERHRFEQLSIADITYSEDMREQRLHQQRLIDGSVKSYQIEKRYIHRTGHTVWVQLTASMVRDDKDNPLYLVIQVEDITSRKEVELALRRSEEKFRSMFELSPVGMALSDLATGHYLEANPSLLNSTGYNTDEFRALRYGDLTPGEYHLEEQEQIALLHSRGCYGPYEYEYMRKDGTRYPILLSGVRISDGSERELILSVVQDISERKAAEAEIHRLAFYDPLTQLANRRLLLDRARQAFHASDRSNNHGAVLFVDLDNFKLLNDTLGHDIGDQLLIEVGKRLSSCVRAGDTVARLGGDEFVVLLENLSAQLPTAAAQCKRVAEKLRSIVNRPFVFGDYVHQTTPSIGVSLFHGNDQTLDELLKHADVALYCAKNSGRNRVCFFDPEMQAALDERAELEADLQDALRQRQFTLFYQAQMDTTAGITCAEVLLRWNSPKRGLVGPNDFIPLAEENGFIVPLGYWVLEAACGKLKEWEANPRTRALQLSVNVSSRQFHQPDFVQQVQQILVQTGADPTKLKMELTETIVLKDIDDTLEKMRALRTLGVRLSMDDFGTGFSSLAYLVQLPFEQIKIDKSFIRNMTIEDATIVVVETIINLAKNLGLEVIAEGVETSEQHELLSRHGCSAFQGYLFGRPIPDTEFERMLHTSGTDAAAQGPGSSSRIIG